MTGFIKRFSVLFSLLLLSSFVFSQAKTFKTRFATVTINSKGYITSIKDKVSGREYVPKGMSSALISLYKNKQYILPVKAIFINKTGNIRLSFSNGAVAILKASGKEDYLRFELVSLDNRKGIDNIVWGPYKTTISKKIGEIISVVRSDDYAIGMMGLTDNTTSGPPSDGDMGFMYYYIHSPDSLKYPLPSHLREGQTFKIGGDGISDIAFYSQPEEYFRMNYGDGAKLEPAFGSSIAMHSRDRRKEQMINFPVLPDNLDGGFNSARHQLVQPFDADFIGSSIALYACPDSLGLKTIERIVLNEGLPHIKVNGKWIKDPAAYQPDIAWWGAHDSLGSYAKQLGIASVQDEGWGEYYPNPANRWANNKIEFTGKPAMTIAAFGKEMKQQGIRYGLHTLCEFLQPGGNSDVAPVPSDSLSIMMRTVLTKDLSANDTMIYVADTSFFNEFGGWEGNHTNVLKIGKELIEYNGITTTKPYYFLHVKRGFHGTVKQSYKAGTTIVKLQPNCYRGFAPDMFLQDNYADYYGRLLTDGGMDYIDFDGLESCIYQGHGQYSFKRFFRNLFDSYQKNGGNYLRVMGSCVYEGNWHYMSVCNVGGGDNMFNPVLNKWGIEGKDMRYVFESNYMPATFGIIGYASDWSLYDAENLQAKSIGWNATYMLGLSKKTVEVSGEKSDIFKVYRLWQDARSADIFTNAVKEKMKNLEYKFHLERSGDNYKLYTIKEHRYPALAYVKDGISVNVNNEFDEQPIELSLRLITPDNKIVNGIKIKIGNNNEWLIDKPIADKQFIIYKSNHLYLADKNRKLLEEIPVTVKPVLAKGYTSINIQSLHDEDASTKAELVVTSKDAGELIKK